MVLPREKNNICLSSPIEVPLETFRWELPEGQAVVKIPAAACTLFAKSSDLTDEVIAQNAKVALIRLTEKMNLSQMRRRVAMHEYEFHNLSVTTIWVQRLNRRTGKGKALSKTHANVAFGSQ